MVTDEVSATRLAASPHGSLSTTMNAFANQFSFTGPSAQLRRAKEVLSEDEDFSEVMWGSQAGFGALAKGVPTFAIPSVPDVSCVRV